MYVLYEPLPGSSSCSYMHKHMNCAYIRKLVRACVRARACVCVYER